ncbi:MAG: hypothetical protein PHI12_07525 [Dehalococcoidales bacterium]|nr:hypothetical protein [Dehalococcoidales bacterium]
MEYAQDTIKPEQYEEMKKVAADNLCSQCGGQLTIHTNPDKKTIEVGCLDRTHHGFIERQSYTQLQRVEATRAGVIVDQINKRMMPRGTTAEDFQQNMASLMAKYPDIGLDPPSAALFLMDCYRLGLEPLMGQPEIVPVVFGKGTTHAVVVEVITEDGYLSGAQRADPEEWDGPPRTMPLQDYLLSLPHLKDRSLADIEKIAKRQALDLCADGEAWVWVALGKRKSGTREDSPSYGWFTKADQKEADSRRVVSAKLPGNQARIRAIKRWVRENFPEWRQKMLDMTSEWIQRSAGVKEAQKLIEAEYKVVEPKKKTEVAVKKAPDTRNKPPGSQVIDSTAKTVVSKSGQNTGDPLEEGLFGNQADGEITMSEEDQKKAIADTRGMINSLATKLNKKMKADKKTRIWPVERLLSKINEVLDTPVTKLSEIPDDKVQKVANLLADWDLIQEE